jgi:hypothetical protein
LQGYSQRIAADECRADRQKALQAAIGRRRAAEAAQADADRAELKELAIAARKGYHWTALDPESALALARAARNSLVAEEEVLNLRVVECRRLLETLEDQLDDTQTRIKEARLQVGGVMEFMDEIDCGGDEPAQPITRSAEKTPYGQGSDSDSNP